MQQSRSSSISHLIATGFVALAQLVSTGALILHAVLLDVAQANTRHAHTPRGRILRWLFMGLLVAGALSLLLRSPWPVFLGCVLYGIGVELVDKTSRDDEAVSESTTLPDQLPVRRSA